MKTPVSGVNSTATTQDAINAIPTTANNVKVYSPALLAAKPTGTNPAMVTNVPVNIGKAVDLYANVAAVSYHFGDKFALYMAVVESALDMVKKISDTTMDTSPAMSAEDKVRHYVHAFLLRIVRADGRMIVQQLIVPRLEFLGAAVAEMIGGTPDDPRVPLCVMSIQSQCLFHAPDRFKSAAFPGWPATDDASIAAAADHIAEFSLAGIRSLASSPPPRRQARHPR